MFAIILILTKVVDTDTTIAGFIGGGDDSNEATEEKLSSSIPDLIRNLQEKYIGLF
jgi:hypothetical protein